MKKFLPCIGAVSLVVATAATGTAQLPSAADDGTTRATRNVVLIISDGVRWQDVFRGPDLELMKKDQGSRNSAGLISDYEKTTTDTRRNKLMPFLWDYVANNGVIYGNQDKGSHVCVTNSMWFSYPGYSETIVGYADDKHITSNRAIPNPNINVFEWLNQQPDLAGKVAGFSSWETMAAIFNVTRSQVPLYAASHEFKPSTGLTPGMKALLALKKASPKPAGGVDLYTYGVFKEYLHSQKPRVIFLNVGETDDYGHEGNYLRALAAINRLDYWLKDIYQTMQGMPEYKDNTTFIFCTDHGRGDKAQDINAWNNHNNKTEGSNNIFLAVWGPDTPALGEATSGNQTQSQIAATVAAALGYNYNSFQPQAGEPVTEALSGK